MGKAATKPQTVLHLTAPAAVGGLESVVLALTSGLHARGHRPVLGAVYEHAPGPDALTARAKAQGVEIADLVLPSRSYLREFGLVADLIRATRPDVVHTHGYRSDLIGGLAARRSGVPWISTLHGFTGGGLKNRLYEWIQMRAARRADALIAVSRPIRDRLSRQGVAAARIHVVPNAAIPRQLLTRAEARRLLGARGSEFLIGWVGRFTREKGADLLLSALASLRQLPWRASIVGTGREGPLLKAFAEQMGIADRIEWHGVVPDAARIYPAFDAWVLSSRTEGTPIALFEAMAARVPVVATAVGGVPDVVSDREAWMVPPEQPEAISAALAQIVRDPAAAQLRAEAAFQRLQHDFAEPAWIATHLALYARLAAREP